ncbi:GTP pyrophosphokinase family protein [Streptomyces sp. NPDC019443]|uniref:GTP pyrophosphokinase family protein n=1 Tax=Streptomyces sp. NPDC019443 TaxID=3365061 RepID=UPI003792774B
MGTFTPEELTAEFQARRGNFAELCEELKFSLTRKLNEAGIKFHSITARVKELESFLEKVERKEYADPFVEAEDLAGARVVCLFMNDLDRVDSVISSIFEVLGKEDKVNEGEVSAFGYMSHHYICRLSDRYAGERYDGLKRLKFEIQVRTILMDAWANMSHYLSYKNEQSIPKGLVKEFHALSALLYIGDRQFENLFRSSSQSAAFAKEQVLESPEIQELEVNADTIEALLERIFSDREPSTAEAVSEFVSELHANTYFDLSVVDQILRERKSEAESKEKNAHIVSSKGKPKNKGNYYNRVGIARTAVDIHDSSFAQYRSRKSRERAERRKLEEEGQATTD